MAKLSSINKNERRKKLALRSTPAVMREVESGRRTTSSLDDGRAADRAPEDGGDPAQWEPDARSQPLHHH